ncbi:cell division protein DivIVA [Erysipelothrix larvae]|uniref:Cell division protein DivIVA n=2 Tax=Erysipelothrix larvae TaxID=1514105 RepID=A0A0X8GYY5_9FIRM|nr:cell division protein DivIVA [Erysipelothrix larvae]
MRSGYDRFEVDQYLSSLEGQLEELKLRSEAYLSQSHATQKQLELQKVRYQQLVKEIAARERALDQLSRDALKEANKIVGTANQNADLIVREALSAARQILVEISRISSESHLLREELGVKLKKLETVVEGLELPEAPNVKLFSDDHDRSSQ